ncbi:hypothetical protein SBV1_2490010 [Verrucomicrobia bacterium]|nr:hypothetical protein SBV1_2490010 [Verrucomicrobiota bacterium]
MGTSVSYHIVEGGGSPPPFEALTRQPYLPNTTTYNKVEQPEAVYSDLCVYVAV